MDGLVDHHEIDHVVLADRVACHLLVKHDHRTSTDVLFDVSVRCTAAEEGIDRHIAKKGSIARADRSAGESD